VGDAANVIFATIQVGHNLSDIYNVVDDDPARREDAVAYANVLLGIETTTLQSQTQNAVSLNGTGKRVRNERMKRALAEADLYLRFPTYREGLDAIARGEYFPFDHDNDDDTALARD
jgi:ABC-type lipopolysaccharide export system ATPase subunit